MNVLFESPASSKNDVSGPEEVDWASVVAAPNDQSPSGSAGGFVFGRYPFNHSLR